MKLKIEIELDNAAFADDPQVEVTRILVDLMDRIAWSRPTSGGDINLRDINGNWVGKARITR